MTRKEETIEMLKILKEQALSSCNDTEVIDVKKDSFIFVINNAIKALEQEPKTGRWIEYARVLIPEPFNKWEQAWYCSECAYGNQESDESAWLEWNYCPNCGAKMVEPQEREE